MTTKVLICNERFLARFGVDRLLVILARWLKNVPDVEVSFACLRCDLDTLTQITSRIRMIALPEGIDLGGADRLVAEVLLKDWSAGHKPDVLVTGGWPFFGVAAQAGAEGVRSLFIDAGAVPHDGFPQGALQSQLELRRLRRATLPRIGTVTAISDFIRRTQSVSDRGRDDVSVVLLGADHLDECKFDPAQSPPFETKLIEDLQKRAAGGAQLLISLGRFETFGYKNSPEIFEIVRSLRKTGINLAVVLLTGPDWLDIPEDIQDCFICAATLTDAALQETMRLCAAGIGLTRWEGFDLPLAEMQWLGKPVLSYLVGAHAEVVVHPWFLCASRTELERKLIAVLNGTMPDALKDDTIYTEFRTRMTWSATLAAWTRLILSERGDTLGASRPRRLIVADVSNSARDPANSGVIRVTRRLTAELQHHADLEVVFATWNDQVGGYEPLHTDHLPFLSSNAGPHDLLLATAFLPSQTSSIDTLIGAADPACSKPPILFLPEVVLDRSADRRVSWARRRGLAVAFVFYDMLPIYEPQHVSPAVAAAFPPYLAAIARSDAFWAISGFSLSEFERYARDNAWTLPARLAVWLPGQFSDLPRAQSSEERRDVDDRFDILCVSTIEPRKNHRVLIKAFQLLRKRQPDRPIYLTLVGNSYASADDLAGWVKKATKDDSHIVWQGIVTDASLADQYRASDITIYPSLAEGFGLPILESLWMGLPCLCNETGVMAELAAGGGCLTVDMTDPEVVSLAIEELADRGLLYEALRRQAEHRAIDTWSDYGQRIGGLLSRLGEPA